MNDAKQTTCASTPPRHPRHRRSRPIVTRGHGMRLATTPLITRRARRVTPSCRPRPPPPSRLPPPPRVVVRRPPHDIAFARESSPSLRGTWRKRNDVGPPAQAPQTWLGYACALWATRPRPHATALNDAHGCDRRRPRPRRRRRRQRLARRRQGRRAKPRPRQAHHGHRRRSAVDRARRRCRFNDATHVPALPIDVVDLVADVSVTRSHTLQRRGTHQRRLGSRLGRFAGALRTTRRTKSAHADARARSRQPHRGRSSRVRVNAERHRRRRESHVSVGGLAAARSR